MYLSKAFRVLMCINIYTHLYIILCVYVYIIYISYIHTHYIPTYIYVLNTHINTHRPLHTTHTYTRKNHAKKAHKD